jgi:hypothetical protein
MRKYPQLALAAVVMMTIVMTGFTFAFIVSSPHDEQERKVSIEASLIQKECIDTIVIDTIR